MTSDQRNIDNFEAQYKRSTTPLLVLQLLKKNEMYAYDIIRETLALTNGIYKMPLLYNILNKLEAEGYIFQSRRIISPDNRTRIYYSITSAGENYLEILTDNYMKLSGAVDKVLFEEKYE